MRNEDAAYFLRRAEAELRLAEQATNPEARKAHSMLAGLYLDRAHESPADLQISAKQPETWGVGKEMRAGAPVLPEHPRQARLRAG
jgi:hypothetical protein